MARRRELRYICNFKTGTKEPIIASQFVLSSRDSTGEGRLLGRLGLVGVSQPGRARLRLLLLAFFTTLNVILLVRFTRATVRYTL